MSIGNKLLAYLVNKDFIGRENERYGRKFSTSLIGTSKADEIWPNTSTRYEHPVLDAISYHVSHKGDCDLLSTVNEKLEENGLDGFTKTHEMIDFSPFLLHGPFRGECPQGNTFIQSESVVAERFVEIILAI